MIRKTNKPKLLKLPKRPSESFPQQRLPANPLGGEGSFGIKLPKKWPDVKLPKRDP